MGLTNAAARSPQAELMLCALERANTLLIGALESIENEADSLREAVAIAHDARVEVDRHALGA